MAAVWKMGICADGSGKDAQEEAAAGDQGAVARAIGPRALVVRGPV